MQATTADIDAIESVLKLLHNGDGIEPDIDGLEVACRDIVSYVGRTGGESSSTTSCTAAQPRSFDELGSLFANMCKSLDEDAMSCGSTNPYPASVQAPMTLETQSECSKLFVFNIKQCSNDSKRLEQ